VRAVHFSKNKYDGRRLPETLKQTSELVDRGPKVVICDRCFRGKSFVDRMEIFILKKPSKSLTTYQ
jgi:hypothetical protein